MSTHMPGFQSFFFFFLHHFVLAKLATTRIRDKAGHQFHERWVIVVCIWPILAYGGSPRPRIFSIYFTNSKLCLTKYFRNKPYIGPFWHNRLLKVVGIRIWRRLVEIFELLFQTGIFEILAKTLPTPLYWAHKGSPGMVKQGQMVWTDWGSLQVDSLIYNCLCFPSLGQDCLYPIILKLVKHTWVFVACRQDSVEEHANLWLSLLRYCKMFYSGRALWPHLVIWTYNKPNHFDHWVTDHIRITWLQRQNMHGSLHSMLKSYWLFPWSMIEHWVTWAFSWYMIPWK